MILEFQLLILSSILTFSTAEIRTFRGLANSNVMVSMTLDETECNLTDGVAQSVLSSSPQYGLIEKMYVENIKRPQCFVKELEIKKSAVSCFCSRSIAADCLNISAMGEAVYQWRRDRTTKLYGSTPRTISKSISKVDCVLNGFHKARHRVNRTAKVNLVVQSRTCTNLTENVRIAVTNASAPPPVPMMLSCGPNTVTLQVHCTEEHCFHQGGSSLSFFLNTFVKLQAMVNKNKFQFDGASCKSIENRSVGCVYTALHHRIANTVLYRVSKNKTSPTSFLSAFSIEEIGDKKFRGKSLDHTSERSQSLLIIVPWLLMCISISPLLIMCVSSALYFSETHGVRQIQHDGTYMKEIEEVISQNIVPPVRKSTSPHEKSKKSEIVHMTVTTTSQIGNMTDLGSEGPVGTASMKNAKLVKSSEELAM